MPDHLSPLLRRLGIAEPLSETELDRVVVAAIHDRILPAVLEALAELLRVRLALVTEEHRHRIHQVRAAGLHHVTRLGGKPPAPDKYLDLSYFNRALARVNQGK